MTAPGTGPPASESRRRMRRHESAARLCLMKRGPHGKAATSYSASRYASSRAQVEWWIKRIRLSRLASRGLARRPARPSPRREDRNSRRCCACF